jgi:hypothetical protein
VIVGGQRILIDSLGRVIFNRTWYPIFDFQIRSRWQVDSPFAHPAVMIRKSALSKSGHYRESFKNSEDLDLWYRLLAEGTGRNLFSNVIAYRTEKLQKSFNRTDEKINVWKHIPFLCAMLRKQRANERLNALSAKTLDWFRETTFVLLNCKTLAYADRSKLMCIAHDIGLIQQKGWAFRTIRTIKTKVCWRLFSPILVIRYAFDLTKKNRTVINQQNTHRVE